MRVTCEVSMWHYHVRLACKDNMRLTCEVNMGVTCDVDM